MTTSANEMRTDADAAGSAAGTKCHAGEDAPPETADEAAAEKIDAFLKGTDLAANTVDGGIKENHITMSDEAADDVEKKPLPIIKAGGESKQETPNIADEMKNKPNNSSNDEMIIDQRGDTATTSKVDGDKTNEKTDNEDGFSASTESKKRHGVQDESSVSSANKKMKTTVEVLLKPSEESPLKVQHQHRQQEQQQQQQQQQAHQWMNALNGSQMMQMIQPQMNQKTVNAQMMNQQMMNQQIMMNAQMMNPWGQGLNGIVPPTMMGFVPPGTNQNPIHSTFPGSNWYPFKLSLPPKEKLGIKLDDKTNLGLPELKGISKKSPIRHQIPEAFHNGCCIVSLKSKAIGHVWPKTANECLELIERSQSGPTTPAELEIVLVPMKKPGPLAIPPKKNPHRGMAMTRKRGRKSADDQFEFNRRKKQALLDFFADARNPTLITFCRETKQMSLRTTLSRIIKMDKRLDMLVHERHVAARRKEAYSIIDRMIPDIIAEKSAALLDFFNNSRSCTLAEFCNKKKLGANTYTAMENIIEDSPSLSKFVDQRKSPEGRREASEIIEQMFAPKASEKTEPDKKRMKRMLMKFFRDSIGSSLAMFCKENKLEHYISASMGRFMDKNGLSQLVDMRDVAERREEALSLIGQLLRNKSKNSTSEKETTNPNSPNSDVGAKTTTKTTRSPRADFFSLDDIKTIASKLDFEARPRMTRDGSKEIEVHDRKLPHEFLTLSIFDLSNRVLKGRSLSLKDKDAAIGSCAKLLFYDYGYKKVTGMSNLDTWERRLERAYLSGADTSPLQRNYEGSSAYTVKVEKEHPGLIEQLYEYTVECIGKEASFRDKAAFMNEKAMENREDDPTLPELRLDKVTLCRWVKRQSGVDAEGSEKTKSHAIGAVSLDQIEKKHPGLIEELYSFAVEALGADTSYHMLATCMNERSKEDVDEDPTLPLVVVSKLTLPHWIKRREGVTGASTGF